MKVKKTHHNIRTKSIQLEQKLAQFTEKISDEKKSEEMLKEIMPIHVNCTKIERIEAEKAVTKSLGFLKNVYDEVGDREFTKTQKQKVERDVQKIMADIPVATLFDAIKCCSDNAIKGVDDKFNSIHPTKKSAPTALDAAINKCRMKIYVDHINTKKLQHEHELCIEQYVQLYDQYLSNMVDEMKVFNGADDAESICSDYLKHYGASMSQQAILQFHQQKLSNLQQLATERDNLLKGNELVAAELSALYVSIEKMYNSTLDDILSLGDVNKNMKQLQGLSKYTINCYGNQSIWNKSSSMLNSTIG